MYVTYPYVRNKLRAFKERRRPIFRDTVYEYLEFLYVSKPAVEGQQLEHASSIVAEKVCI
jgi:hypothetical protein